MCKFLVAISLGLSKDVDLSQSGTEQEQASVKPKFTNATLAVMTCYCRAWLLYYFGIQSVIVSFMNGQSVFSDTLALRMALTGHGPVVRLGPRPAVAFKFMKKVGWGQIPCRGDWQVPATVSNEEQILVDPKLSLNECCIERREACFQRRLGLTESWRPLAQLRVAE